LIARLGSGPVEIVAHQAAFKRAFLEVWPQREGLPLLEIHWSCTLEEVRALRPRLRSAIGWGNLPGSWAGTSPGCIGLAPTRR